MSTNQAGATRYESTSKPKSCVITSCDFGTRGYNLVYRDKYLRRYCGVQNDPTINTNKIQDTSGDITR